MNDNIEQLDLNFAAPVGDGYAVWQGEHKEALRRISETWGIPLGCRVRLRLSGIDREFTGVLKLAEMPTRLDRRIPLKLKMGRHGFESQEIEACLREME